MRTRVFLLLPTVLFLLLVSTGQVVAQNDSLALYRNIERVAGKYKVTRWIYDAIFVAPVSDEAPAAAGVPQRRVDPNIKYKGRVVRSINVQVLDPFGFSVDDTIRSPTNFVQRTGNAVHRRTRGRVVRGLLVVRTWDRLDPFKVMESERLLRASPVVNDAAIRVVPVRGTRDSVDVFVLVHDKWNIDVSGEGDLGSASGTFRDRNVLGWGHELEQRVLYVPDQPELELQGKYSIYNIRRSYIGSTFSYSTSTTVDRAALSFDRSFYSPLTRWAGGFGLGKSWSSDVRTDALNGTITAYPIAPVVLDTWLARSFRLGDGVTAAGRSSNIVVGARYALTQYAARPPVEVDSIGIYSNTALYLVSAGLSMRQYYEERYLYRFGATEDVPEGLLSTVSAGFLQRGSAAALPYIGFTFSMGANTDRLGYLSGTLGYGTFFDHGEAADGTLRADLSYFSNLAALGRWHLRAFARAHCVLGFDKPVYSRITISGTELYGLNGNTLSGTHKTLLNLEAVAYAPYTLLGFRFAPVLLIGFGNVGQETEALFSGRIYSAYSFGLLIRNENLLVKTFEISVAYYPYLPDGGRSVFQVNPSISFSLGARDFAFSRPDLIPY
ncbi:MAG: hypothetical protein ABI599_11705 [Flavobacteriales bacterium]